MNGSDGFMSPGTAAFRQAGVGLAMTRNCMVGDHNTVQDGGTYVRWRGIKCWACGRCAARLAEKRSTPKEAA